MDFNLGFGRFDLQQRFFRLPLAANVAGKKHCGLAENQPPAPVRHCPVPFSGEC